MQKLSKLSNGLWALVLLALSTTLAYKTRVAKKRATTATKTGRSSLLLVMTPLISHIDIDITYGPTGCTVQLRAFGSKTGPGRLVGYSESTRPLVIALGGSA